MSGHVGAPGAAGSACAAAADWLRRRRLDDAVRRAAGRGTRVLGVCGGAMLLGTEVTDPHDVEGATAGLGLLPISTEMAATKTTRPVRVSVSELTGPWAALGGARADGNELGHGAETQQRDGGEVAPQVADGTNAYLEDVAEGLENAPRAFMGLRKGKTRGKQLVRVSPSAS